MLSRIRYYVEKKSFDATLLRLRSLSTNLLAPSVGFMLTRIKITNQKKDIKFINFKPYLTPSTSLYNNDFLSFSHLCDCEAIFFQLSSSYGIVKADVT